MIPLFASAERGMLSEGEARGEYMCPGIACSDSLRGA